MTETRMLGMGPEPIEKIEYGINRYRPERGEEEITLKRYEIRKSLKLADCVLFISEEEAADHVDIGEDFRFEDFRYGSESFLRLDHLLFETGR